MVASQEGNVEVVDKLLQHGATVDLQNAVFTFIAVIPTAAKFGKYMGLRSQP